MSYFLTWFLAGLPIGVHCVFMCGPLVLTYAVKGNEEGPLARRIYPHFAYQSARIFSYMLVGLALGLVGTALNLGGIRGWAQIVAGVFMILLGLSLTGWFPVLRRLQPQAPKFFMTLLSKMRRKASADAAEGHVSFAMPIGFGLLTGLMPCGPLWGAEIAAVGAGSPVNGALVMMGFGLGTLPIMLGVGALVTFIGSLGKAGSRVKEAMMVVGAIVVVVLGFVMLDRGAMLLGSPVTFNTVRQAVLGTPAAKSGDYKVASDGAVEVPLKIENVRFVPSALSIPAGKRVRLIVDRREADYCSSQLAIPSLGVLANLKDNGVTEVDIPASKAGNYTLTCGMGMMAGSVKVGDAAGSSLESLPSKLAIPVVLLLAVILIWEVRRRRKAERAAGSARDGGSDVALSAPGVAAAKGEQAAEQGQAMGTILGFQPLEALFVIAAAVSAITAGLWLGSAATAKPVQQIQLPPQSSSAYVPPGSGVPTGQDYSQAEVYRPPAVPTSSPTPGGPGVSSVGGVTVVGPDDTKVGPNPKTGEVQRVSVAITSRGYSPSTIILKAGVPALITFGKGTGCFAGVMSNNPQFYADLTSGPRTVSIPALSPGNYSFSCAMRMVFGTIAVR